MTYAKLENGVLHYAPRKLRIGDAWVYNPTGEQLLAEGYLPVVETEPPEAEPGWHYDGSWEQREDSIVRIWTLAEDPEPVPELPTPEEQPDLADKAEAYDILMGVSE